jgi:hypothetical protein
MTCRVEKALQDMVFLPICSTENRLAVAADCKPGNMTQMPPPAVPKANCMVASALANPLLEKEL